MHTDLLAPLATLRLRLSTTLRDRRVVSFSVPFVFLLLLLHPLPVKLVVYFSPLLFSTAICFTAFCRFVQSERQAMKEILLVRGERSERGVVQVYGDAEVNRSVYGDRVEACCFLLRPELEEGDGRVMFAGEINVGAGDRGVFGEEVASCVVDRMAEVAWNRYFGRSSKWHHAGNPMSGSGAKGM